MKAAKTNIAERLQAAALPGAKIAAQGLPGQDGFLSQLKGELTLAEALGHGGSLQGAAKKKLGEATADALASTKLKAKQTTKTNGESVLSIDVKAADGAAALAGMGAIGAPVAGVPGDVPPAAAVKKETGDTKLAPINSAPTGMQQAPLPVDMAAGPVEIAAGKQVDASVLEVKTKRVPVSAIVGLSEKPASGVAAADGLQGGVGANGMPVGGVAGQAMQGGQSSGSSAHHGQSSGSHAGAGAGPQVVASSPSQLDVGVYDDTHGWLRIRAELGAGGAVNATLTSADAAHESLRTTLPEMTHYLGTESVHVNSIELHKFGDTTGGQPGSHGEAQQQQSMAGQHASGDEQQQASAQANVMAALDDAVNRNVAAVAEAPSGMGVDAVGAASAVAAVSATDAVNSTGVVDGALAAQPGDVEMPDFAGAHGLPWQVGYGGSGGWVNLSA